MQEKSFATCFDKNCEEFAELLMTLVSETLLFVISTRRKRFLRKIEQLHQMSMYLLLVQMVLKLIERHSLILTTNMAFILATEVERHG